MNQELINALMDQSDVHDKEIESLKQTMQNLPDYKESFTHLDNQLIDLKATISRIRFPEKDIQDLSHNLAKGIQVFQQPVQTKHHHYVPKIIIITASLFLVLCLVCMGWYHTGQQLSAYKASDTKYRYLKLDGNKNLGELLHLTDSLYRANPDMRDSIIKKEEANNRRLELVEEIRYRETELKQLK